MSVHESTQSGSRAAQLDEREFDAKGGRGQPRDVAGRGSIRTLLSERQAAEYCCFFERDVDDPVRCFQRWARRAGVPVKRCGRARLYDPKILDAFLERQSWTRRHRNVKAGESQSSALRLVGSARVR